MYVWDVEGGGEDAVRLVGHEREVGGVSWANDTVSSSTPCYSVHPADDGRVG